MLRRRGGTPGRRKQSDQWHSVANGDSALRSYIVLGVCTGGNGAGGGGEVLLESRVCN